MNFFLLLIPRLPRSRLFPYTTLFRSARLAAERRPAAAPDDRTRAVAGPRAAAARRVLDRRRPGHDDADRGSAEGAAPRGRDRARHEPRPAGAPPRRADRDVPRRRVRRDRADRGAVRRREGPADARLPGGAFWLGRRQPWAPPPRSRSRPPASTSGTGRSRPCSRSTFA